MTHLGTVVNLVIGLRLWRRKSRASTNEPKNRTVTMKSFRTIVNVVNGLREWKKRSGARTTTDALLQARQPKENTLTVRANTLDPRSRQPAKVPLVRASSFPVSKSSSTPTRYNDPTRVSTIPPRKTSFLYTRNYKPSRIRMYRVSRTWESIDEENCGDDEYSTRKRATST